MDREKRLAENLEKVRERISRAAERAGRKPSEIELVAVCKRRSIEETLALVRAGQKVIAENRVQEAKEKYSPKPEGAKLHLIGHLQKNKAKQALELFDLIQSVDSADLAERLQQVLEKEGGKPRKAPIFIQINAHRDPAKSGFWPEQIEQGVERIASLDRLEIKGMMSIAPLTQDLKVTRIFFRDTRQIFESWRDRLPSMETLSMGMTDDFEIAVEEGSGMVRIGRALFELGKEKEEEG